MSMGLAKLPAISTFAQIVREYDASETFAPVSEAPEYTKYIAAAASALLAVVLLWFFIKRRRRRH